MQTFLRSLASHLSINDNLFRALKAAKTRALPELNNPAEEKQLADSEIIKSQDDQLRRFFNLLECPR